MERISVRALATAIRLVREPLVVTYSYPRNHPLYGAGEECGVYVPMKEWKSIIDGYENGWSRAPELHVEQPGAKSPDNQLSIDDIVEYRG